MAEESGARIDDDTPAHRMDLVGRRPHRGLLNTPLLLVRGEPTGYAVGIRDDEPERAANDHGGRENNYKKPTVLEDAAPIVVSIR
jgi:hypothetical protein